MIHSVKVLNTVTALGTDVSVDSSGILNMAGVATSDAYNVRNVAINTPVAPVAGVIQITPSVSTAATFYINGFSKATGLPKTMIVTYAANTVALEQAAIVAIVNADSDFTVSASLSSTYVNLTSATGYSPEFTVGGALASVNSLVTQSGTTIVTGVAVTAVTGGGSVLGVIAAGTPAILQNKYGYDSNSNSMTYSDMANLTTGYYYTEVIIDWLGTGYSGNSGFKGEISTNQTVIFVRQGTTAGTVTTTNYNDLLGTYGTVTGLAAGYRVTGSALSTAITGGALNSTTQVQTVTGGTLASTLDVVGGDYLVSITTTPIIAKVISTLSETTFLSSNTTALGSNLNLFKWRALPL
jgi:hypothetical protein